MVVKGDAIVIVLDVGKSMHKKTIDSYLTADGCLTALEEAKKCIGMIIQRKIFSESKDEIALILFGCDDTSDDTDEESYSEEYKNINIVQNLQPASWKLLELVNNIQGTDISTDLIRGLALHTAINLLQNVVNVKKIDSQRILLFSSFDGYLYDDKHDMICNNLKDSNIEINIITPLAYPGHIKKEIDADECQNETEVKYHILDILREVNGESYSFCDVLSAITNYQMKKVQPTASNVNLEIGTLTIPVSVYIKVTESKPKAWKIACVHNVNEMPKRSTTYCMNDELQTKVSHEDIIPAFKYGTTLVPYSENDKNMDYQSKEKGMKLLGFTKAERVQRYLYMGDKSRYVYSQKNNECAGESLAAFIHALHATRMVAIVRFVSTARSAPVIGFLSPIIKPNYECFVFIALPFMEDLRHLVFTRLDSESRNVPTEEQLDAVDELMIAMDLTIPFDKDEEDMLEPKNTANPYVQRLFQCLQYRAFHPEKPLPPIEPHIQAVVNPVPNLLKRAETSLKKMKSLFPTKEYIPKKLPQTGPQLFSNKNESNKDDLVNEDVLEAKFNITEDKLVDVMTDKITKVGSVNPVRDMQYLINNQILPFNEVCEQINDVVNKLLQDGDRLRFNYSKILSICKEYRCSSLKKADCEKYNHFMLSLQKHLLEIKEELWNKIKNEKIELISKEELPSSVVSVEQAEMFLSKSWLPENFNDSVKTPVPCGIDDDDDEDDLMDQL